ncbi:SID1 transmembrane family member 2 isoform X4 [Anomaloglossus baeobatrachus]|uniref:SID1 transmembrane family member 2 isoform X4 n=1 Tax=Anomaloglossus baeobatrachus TaxID=238106 RepID=UPI003F509E17
MLTAVCILLLVRTVEGLRDSPTKDIVQKDADFNQDYNDTVNSDLQNIYAFNHTMLRNKTEGVRVSVKVLSDQKGPPLLFVVRQKEAVVSFQVPLTLRGLYQRNYQYQDVGRTLCQPPTRAESKTESFFVDVSTLSEKNATYFLRVTHVDSFVLRTEELFSFNATPAQPQYFKYGFPPEVDSVIVKVKSPSAFPCSVISIQDIQCPVYDLDNNVAFIGMYQTMTKQAAITVQRKDFNKGGFYVVVVVKTEDEACGGGLPYYPLDPDTPVEHGDRQKTLDVLVSPAISKTTYVGGMLFCLGVFLSFYLFALLVYCWEQWRKNKKEAGLIHSAGSLNDETASLLGKASIDQRYDGCSYGSIAENSSVASPDGTESLMSSAEATYSYTGQDQFKRRTLSAIQRPLNSICDKSLENMVPRPRLESLSSVEEDDYDTLTDIESDKNVIRTKKFLCVADLARKDKRVMRKKYQIYFWNISTIAVFYALPVVQLVITYQTVVNVTGNQDICYYNFLCAHPLGSLSAFNNILSNLGYIMLGLLFLIIVLQRELRHNRSRFYTKGQVEECGIPKHFGLFYAMGTALMMEGLLSACYHVCPNYTNFQFDTSFMYMIAGLCMLKLYQKRHPDINASAYSAYACLAIVIFFSVLGVVFGKGNTIFWIVFSVIHIVFTLVLSTQLYYMGRWRLDSGIVRRILQVLYTDCVRQCSPPMYVDRMVLLVMGNIINWSLKLQLNLESTTEIVSYSASSMTTIFGISSPPSPCLVHFLFCCVWTMIWMMYRETRFTCSESCRNGCD